MSDQHPEPAVMPMDRNQWFKELHLCNFVNSYYQFRDLQGLPECRSILLIGPGQGLDTQILRWRGYDVMTFDIDDTFQPDVSGSVHKMGMFTTGQFDAVIASHVLEHLAEPLLDRSLREIARIGRYAIIYLPVHGRHIQLRLIPGFMGLDFSLVFDLFSYWKKPDGITPHYMAGQHYWEVGMRGFRVRDLIRRMSPYFEIVSVYRNKDWLPSQNFVLRSTQHKP